MVEVVFDYKQIKTVIQGNLDDLFENIIKKYVQKSNLDINNIYFISNGKTLNRKDKLESIMSELEKRSKKIIILVYSINSTINIENTNIKKSNDIICPECKEICRYEIKDYKIKLYDCNQGHIKENIKFDEFENIQNYDISQIKCDKCKNKNKSNTFNNEFYICYECKMNLCPLCKSIHDKTHSIINYDNKNYICNKHNEIFLRYCEDCNIDLCLSCTNEHKNHKIVLYEDKIIDIKKLRKKMNEFKDVINKFKLNLEEIMNKFKKIMKNMDILYNINNDILSKYEKNKNRNYKLLSNLNFMDKYIEKEIKNIKYEYDYGNNLNKLLYLYTEMTDKNEEIEIIYKPDEDNEEKVRIFGEAFVNNNKKNCKIIYNNKEYPLKEYLNNIDKEYNNKDEIKIKLKGINNITNMSYMFSECEALSSLPDISKWNTSNVNDMSNIFNGCEVLSSLPDISKWNTSNVSNMNSIFHYCNALISLPDISKWDTSKVINMNSIFSNCISLSALPDISKWNTSKVTNMRAMFYYCNSLSLLPDISKWDTSKVTDMSLMFSYCCKLSSLPDISKWNTSKVTNMRSMFYNCNKLSLLPDISKWDTYMVTDMRDMFYDCKESLNIPSKFKK